MTDDCQDCDTIIGSVSTALALVLILASFLVAGYAITHRNDPPTPPHPDCTRIPHHAHVGWQCPGGDVWEG